MPTLPRLKKEAAEPLRKHDRSREVGSEIQTILRELKEIFRYMLFKQSQSSDCEESR